MCGDDEEHDHEHHHLDEHVYQHFLELAGQYKITPDQNAGSAPAHLNDEMIRTVYLEGLLKAGLTRSINDAATLPEGERMDVIAGQALVFARLAGLLAGLFPHDSDVFHSVISALMEGHKEAAHID
jgi:hypothetical protein